MSNKARNATIIGIAIGLLAAPFVYKAIRNRRRRQMESDTDYHGNPALFPAYRGKHKPHHRRAGLN